jgi:hypothetical protein
MHHPVAAHADQGAGAIPYRLLGLLGGLFRVVRHQAFDLEPALSQPLGHRIGRLCTAAVAGGRVGKQHEVSGMRCYGRGLYRRLEGCGQRLSST